MIRMLARLTLSILANAVGLIVASILLEDFQVNGAAFVVAVLVFTVAYILLEPLLIKVSLKSVPAIRGGVALITTFVGLLITTLLSDGINITSVQGWVLATLIVWLFGVVATVVLPLFLFKKTLGKDSN